jgi:SAM-dependent methyltransferase
MPQLQSDNILGFQQAKATEWIACPVCGSEHFDPILQSGDYEYRLPGSFHIARCRSCRLLLQNPRPSFDEILRYYTEEYEPYRKVGSSLVQKVRDYVLLKPRVELYRRLIGSTGRILDVGCANGELLNHLRRRGAWELWGVEPNKAVVSIALNEGVRIIPTLLEAARIPDESVDLAIMNHVLEHLPDPRRTVSSLFRALKPGGYFVGEIPSPNCLERFVFQKYWGGFHLPRHLTFFSAYNIKSFLISMGFQDAQIRGTMQASNWVLSFSNFLKANHYSEGLIRAFHPHSFFWLSVSTPISYAFKLCGSWPILHFCARKPISQSTSFFEELPGEIRR